MMTDEVIIRRYKEDDHEVVRKIFSSGIVENSKTGILLGLRSPRVIGMLTAALAVGSVHSLLLGLCLLLIAMVIYFILIYSCYYAYARYDKIAQHVSVFWRTS